MFPFARTGIRRAFLTARIVFQFALIFFPSFSSCVRPCTARREQPASSNILA
ncbi:hypothetical protein Hanom_Chr09g00861551 [Helianthus anomalus]